MFNFGKKDDDKKKKDLTDPKQALQNASDKINKGFMGGLTKAFMGKEFVNKMNDTIAQGNQAVDAVQANQEVAKNGADAQAEVLSVQDTGTTLNMNPVVILTLKVTPAVGAEFQTAAQVVVSRIAIPRTGDKIKIKYNPENPSQVAIVQ